VRKDVKSNAEMIPKSPVKSLEKALIVLELMMTKERDLSVTEIGKGVGLGKGTVHRILNTLKARKFVQQDPASRKYSLGVGTLNLVGSGKKDEILRKAIRGALINLGQRCKETVSAAVLEFGQIRYIVRHESEQILRVSIQEGTRFPAHCCATGKVLLSALTDEDVKRLFVSERGIKKCTPHSMDSLQGILETLHKVRKEKTAFDFEEALIGVHCMAAPIFNSKGDTVAAISISGPRDRVTRKKMREYQPLLIETARDISKELGFSQ
jgi:IclR family KDG regulon transcriptional repressor